MMLTTHELGGDGDPLFFVHGNGLHAHTLAPLAAHFDDRRCIGVDLRGFGHSTAPTTDSFDWQTHGSDLCETIEAMGLLGADVFGHSMGGATSLMAELAASGTFGRMALYEPVVMPPPYGGDTPSFEATLRRRFTFESREAAVHRFGSKPPWSSTTPEALDAYVEWGLQPNRDGDGFELRCDPRHEANNYRAGVAHDTWDHLGLVRAEVLVMSGTGGGAAGAAPGIASRLPHGTHHQFSDLGHFGPLQDPEAVATRVRQHFAD